MIWLIIIVLAIPVCFIAALCLWKLAEGPEDDYSDHA